MSNHRLITTLAIMVVLLTPPPLHGLSGGAPPQVRLGVRLSPGWDTKELFVPVLERIPGDPFANERILGARNRRDMWYIIEISGQAGTYKEYLPPYGERKVRYPLQLDDRITIKVVNDLNDNVLAAFWIIDIAFRAFTGEAFFSLNLGEAAAATILGAFAPCGGPVLDLISLDQKDFIKIIAECALSVLSSIYHIPGLTLAPVKNYPLWKDLYSNAAREPFREEVTLSVIEIQDRNPPDLRVTSSLKILQEPPYQAGQKITSAFSITNTGTTPTTLNILTAGGRGPGGSDDVRDFEFDTSVTIDPGQTYDYQGDLRLLQSGNYHFFVAYQTTDGHWNTSVPTELGKRNTLDITVLPASPRSLARVSVSPSSGIAGTPFNYQGEGLTTNGNITSHLRRPDGTEFDTLQIPTDSAGRFSLTINSTAFAVGPYQVWAVDNTTGVSSNVERFTVTDSPNPPPEIFSINPSEVVGSTFDLTINGTNFNPTGAIDQVYQPTGRFMGQGIITSRTSTQIVVTQRMAGAAPGNYFVRVKNPDGQLSNAITLRLISEVSISPSSSPAGTQFDYQGAGFTGNFGVTSHLRKPDGTEFATLQIPTDQAGRFSHTIDSTNFAPGTYQIWAIDNNTGISSNVVSFTINKDSGDDQLQENEPNDSIALANPVTLPALIHGVLNPTGDVDFFGFDAVAGQRVIIDVDAQTLAPPSNADTIVTLYDAHGNQVAENDDDGMTLDSYLEYVIPAAGRYYLRVRDVNGGGGSTYTYRVRIAFE